MKRYRIKLNGKEIVSRGEDAQNAFDRYANRLVFGGNTILHPTEYRLEQIDADTRGEKWASFWVKDESRAIVELIEN